MVESVNGFTQEPSGILQVNLNPAGAATPVAVFDFQSGGPAVDGRFFVSDPALIFAGPGESLHLLTVGDHATLTGYLLNT